MRLPFGWMIAVDVWRETPVEDIEIEEGSGCVFCDIGLTEVCGCKVCLEEDGKKDAGARGVP